MRELGFARGDGREVGLLAAVISATNYPTATRQVLASLQPLNAILATIEAGCVHEELPNRGSGSRMRQPPLTAPCGRWCSNSPRPSCLAQQQRSCADFMRVEQSGRPSPKSVPALSRQHQSLCSHKPIRDVRVSSRELGSLVERFASWQMRTSSGPCASIQLKLGPVDAARAVPAIAAACLVHFSCSLI